MAPRAWTRRRTTITRLYSLWNGSQICNLALRGYELWGEQLETMRNLPFSIVTLVWKTTQARRGSNYGR